MKTRSRFIEELTEKMYQKTWIAKGYSESDTENFAKLERTSSTSSLCFHKPKDRTPASLDFDN